jgi:hypothetical protein
MKTTIFSAIFIIVITDPYKGIKYGEIDVYNYETKCKKKCIEVIEPEETGPPKDDDSKTWSDYLSDKYRLNQD